MEGTFKKLTLDNFQAHKHTELELHEGVNVITGPSDGGKSSIIRALNWLRNNRPLGDEPKNWEMNDEEKTVVSLSDSSEKRVSLSRLKNNSYTIGRKKLDVIKTDVPSEISEYFNMSEVNVQEQHESYFLLDLSPGEVARKLNKEVGLDIIDTMLKNLNGWISYGKRTIESKNTDLEETEKKIESLSYIISAETELKKLEKRQNDLSITLENHEEVKELVERINELTESINNSSAILNAEKPAIALQNRIKNLEELKAKYNLIQGLMTSILDIDESIKVNEEWLKVEEPAVVLKKRIDDLNELKRKTSSVLDLCERVIIFNNEIKTQEDKIEELKKAANIVIMKERICPLCGSKIDSSIIERIIK